jgi:hypothetical protein
VRYFGLATCANDCGQDFDVPMRLTYSPDVVCRDREACAERKRRKQVREWREKNTWVAPS